jgi:hypothetical protein
VASLDLTIGAMLHRDPPDDVLRKADIITLVDPEVLGWHQNVIGLSRQRGYDDLVVVHIPVDSTNSTSVRAWRDRITAARA